MPPQPAVFVSHGGGPWPFMDDPSGMWDGLTADLRSLPDMLPRPPDAIVVVTAHWEAPVFTVAAGARPELIYDYGGFPAHTYEVRYPAPGAPAVAARIAELAREAGIDVALDAEHGWDHGVFVPLSVGWPDADVPLVAVSLRNGLDPEAHLRFGEAIGVIREENVLILGSGMSTHDLSFRVDQATAAEFDDWLASTMDLPAGPRAERLLDWADAPGARSSHPREEHLLPLMVVAGAGGDHPAVRRYHDEVFGLPAAGFTIGV